MPAKSLPLAVAQRSYPAIVIDTNIVIDAFKADQRGMAPPIPLPTNTPLVVCVVTLYEFIRGAKAKLLPPAECVERFRWLEDRRIGRLPTRESAGKNFERIIRTDRCPPSLADALIAAACLAEQRPLLTRNVADFQPVDGLVLIELPG